MPMTVNGFGTSVCGGRGNIGWGSFDAMEWLVALYLPIIPIKAVHTFDWNGEQYRMIPIRWSFDLVVRTFFHRWVWVLGIIGAILFFVGITTFQNTPSDTIGWFIAGTMLIALAIGVGVFLAISDRRNKNIRLLIGPMTIGNCDPVHLPQHMLDDMAADTQVMYGASSYAKAAQKLLAKGSFAKAMWCARMATVLEDVLGGETLTDEILADEEVKDSIGRVRKNAGEWAAEMMSDDDLSEAARANEPVEELPIVEDLPDRPRRSDDNRIRGD